MIDNKLITLISLSQTGSYTKTARLLSLTQPAITQHIKALEKELGITIFEKDKNSLKTTFQGKIAIDYAKRIKAIYDQEVRTIRESRENAITLTLGLTANSNSQKMETALALVSSNIKGLTINIVTDTINFLYTKIDSYEIDFGIVDEHDIDPTFGSLLLDTDSLGVVLPSNDMLATKNVISIKELSKKNLILESPGSSSYNLFNSSLKDNGHSLKDLKVGLTVPSASTILDLVEKGVGISVLPKSVCQKKTADGSVVFLPIAGLPMISELNIVFPKDFSHKEILKEIVAAYQAL